MYSFAIDFSARITKKFKKRHLSQHMRFWFTDIGSSETQMCRFARAFAVRIIKPNLPFEPAHSQGLPVPLFPWWGRGEQRDNIVFVPPFPLTLKIWPLFPCILEINSPFPLFPKTPRRASEFSTYHTYWYCDDTGMYDFFTFDSILVKLLSILSTFLRILTAKTYSGWHKT